ncbi:MULTISPECIES: hypothetical protein [Oscillatoriales]|uniref:hypothetical protein n=1 Tax=Oscillatoriales TaxID=1150 RepID=UPI0005A03B6A|nr:MULTISPECIES: hypothetical protein [Oscillatoriales]MBE9093283.1 hypothetical protein [Tychonema sp. LEGE 07203]MBE9123225.1 hypothetical protein [Tychonema sp. LEGE 07199]MBE9133693.1 hypothetical protein [Tychonema sp. LEGE 07196]
MSETAADVVRCHWEARTSCYEAVKAEATKTLEPVAAETAAPFPKPTQSTQPKKHYAAPTTPATAPTTPAPAAAIPVTAPVVTATPTTATGTNNGDEPPNRGDNGRSSRFRQPKN